MLPQAGALFDRREQHKNNGKGCSAFSAGNVCYRFSVQVDTAFSAVFAGTAVMVNGYLT